MMAIELVMARRGSTLVSASAYDQAELERFPHARALRVTVDYPAPLDLTRLYRALCAKIAAATGMFPDGEAVHTALMLRAHKVSAVYVASDGSLAKGTPLPTGDWSLPEWRAYFDFVWPIILEEILPGIPESRLRGEIEEMAGVRMAASRGAAA
ncbi:hypothetical protein AB4037_23085 [Labrys sp. KB_33_2]|uniref:hypothetical protein n=1 Tax=Labrys sp. KB_33_2 TaxID=3237479 RepID=UPI003F8EEDDB